MRIQPNSWGGEFARDAEKLGVNSLLAVPLRDSIGTLSHQPRTWERHLQDLAWFNLLLLLFFKIFGVSFFYLSEMPAVCVWAGTLSMCSWVFQQIVFWCGGTGVNLNSANWEGSLSPGQQGWAQSSQEGKSSTCSLGLQVFTSPFGLCQENKGITSGLWLSRAEHKPGHPWQEEQNHSPGVLITDTLLIIIVMMIIIHIANRCFTSMYLKNTFPSLVTRIFFIYLFGGRRSLLLEEETKGLSESCVTK